MRNNIKKMTRDINALSEVVINTVFTPPQNMMEFASTIIFIIFFLPFLAVAYCKSRNRNKTTAIELATEVLAKDISRKSSHYEVLGLQVTASAHEIKKARDKLGLIHHPDKKGDPAKFTAVDEAFKTLSDATKRKIYDTLLQSQCRHASVFFSSKTGVSGVNPQETRPAHASPRRQTG